MPRPLHAVVHKYKHPRQHPVYVFSFISLHRAKAKVISAHTGIPAEVILAQSALECDWGWTVKGNAYFGIKGKSPKGYSTTFATHEVTLSGQRVSETDAFRAYASYAEAANDYASLIKRKYPAAFVYAKDPEKFAETIASQGYATDREYAKKLKSIIRAHVAPLLDK